MRPDTRRILAFELGDALIKSWWTLVAGVCIGLAGGLLALSMMTKQYQAATHILVAPQAIPEEFVETTVTEDITRRLMILEEAELTERYKRERTMAVRRKQTSLSLRKSRGVRVSREV